MKPSGEKKMSNKILKAEINELSRVTDEIGFIPTMGNCSVHYPWHHPYNEVPNCLIVLSDGFPMLKFEVGNLDNNLRFAWGHESINCEFASLFQERYAINDILSICDLRIFIENYAAAHPW